jgi:hypothetical protein
VIVWIEIRFCTPVLGKSRREATMGSSPTLPQVASPDDAGNSIRSNAIRGQKVAEVVLGDLGSQTME